MLAELHELLTDGDALDANTTWLQALVASFRHCEPLSEEQTEMVQACGLKELSDETLARLGLSPIAVYVHCPTR